MYKINGILEEVKDVACKEEWKEALIALYNKPWDEVIKHPKATEWACWYAKNVLKAPWPEAEDIIKQDPKWAYNYAKDVLKTRWPEAEDTIKKDP